MVTNNLKYTKRLPDEKIVAVYTDNSGWLAKKTGTLSAKHGVGYHPIEELPSPGILCITNKRIIYENLDNSNILFSIKHREINRTGGKNHGTMLGGELVVYYDNGNVDRGFWVPKGKDLSDYLNATFYTDEEKLRRIIKRAKNREKHLDYNGAIQLYKSIGNDKEAARVRRKMYDEKKVDQTVVHGDYVDDRDTIVKDSVISKSNIGSGGDDKIAKLEKIAEMKDKGIIDDDEFKQMKKEILKK